MGRLKPIIKPFDSGWNYILDLSLKLISLLVIWPCNCNNAVKKQITRLGTSVTVNLEDTTNITLSSFVGHNTNPFLPTFHIMV